MKDLMANKIKTKQEQIEELQKQIKEEKAKVEMKIGKQFLKTFQLEYESEKEALTLIKYLYDKYQPENESAQQNKEPISNNVQDDKMNKIDRLESEINSLELEINRDKYKVRKQRTRRLIQKGGLLEKYFECDHLSVEDTEELLKTFSTYVNANKPKKLMKEL